MLMDEYKEEKGVKRACSRGGAPKKEYRYWLEEQVLSLRMEIEQLKAKHHIICKTCGDVHTIELNQKK